MSAVAQTSIDAIHPMSTFDHNQAGNSFAAFQLRTSLVGLPFHKVPGAIPTTPAKQKHAEMGRRNNWIGVVVESLPL